jgi:hypothetical protein
VQNRLLCFGLHFFLADHFKDRQPIQRPAMRVGHGTQLIRGLRQGDVETGLAPGGTMQQELQRQRGFPGPRASFQQVQPIRGDAAAQHIVQTLDAKRHSWAAFADSRLTGLHMVSPQKLRLKGSKPAAGSWYW